MEECTVDKCHMSITQLLGQTTNMQAVYSTHFQPSPSVVSLVGEDHIQNAEEYEDGKGLKMKEMHARSIGHLVKITNIVPLTKLLYLM